MKMTLAMTKVGWHALKGRGHSPNSHALSGRATQRAPWVRMVLAVGIVNLAGITLAAHPHAAERITSLTNTDVKFTTPAANHVVLRRGPITAVIVDNSAVDVPECPGHRAGYNGVAVLKHARRDSNYFVPAVAGLNFEHIHDGSREMIDKERFEPRKAPMQLRVVDEHTVEVHQPPTPNMQLESCGRYRLLDDGTIEYTFECIPRADTYRNGYLGLFWASYINQPESTEIQFRGQKAEETEPAGWIRATSRAHGVDSTHPPAGPLPKLPHDDPFPATLIFNRSPFVYTEPWYFGVSHGLAYVQMFRERDRIWFGQSPTGGGNGNPAWDFQWFVFQPKVGEAYGFTMRAALLAETDRDAIQRGTEKHRTPLKMK